MSQGLKKTAIITDGLWRKSISAIRSAGRAGYEVVVLGDSVFTTGFYSRFTAQHLLGPTAAGDPQGFGPLLEKAVAQAKDRPVIIPMEDATCEWLLDHGDGMANAADWLLPSKESFTVARDKALTIQLAQRLGLDCPRTHFPESAAELGRLVAGLDPVDLENWIIKPRTGSGSAGIVYGGQILRTDLATHWNGCGPLLLQERIPAEGTAYGVSVLYDRSGLCQVAFAHKRLQQYPHTGGPSTQRVAIPLDGLLQASTRLLDALHWRGVAMVEWKEHPKTGRRMLMEINPRFWGSLELGIRAGVDFPALYIAAASGLPLPSLPAYQSGVRCRWLVPGDILRYLSAPTGTRESIREFFRGFWAESEEFDRGDIRGSIACWICPALLILNPKYWRYLRRSAAKDKPGK